MTRRSNRHLTAIGRIPPRFLPFADAASPELPLPRLLRLSLFQVSVGMATVLITGTLNRVMIVELGVPAFIVAVMVSIPLLFAPLRALIGHRSDVHRSALGWRRVPYIWLGSLVQFGGLAIMPFALLVLSDQTLGPAWAGEAGAALAFLLVGAGLHTTQTAGLALATDIAPAESRPRVVALLYVMLLVGMIVSALLFGFVLRDYSPLHLIQVIQGCAVVTMVLNGIALWKQEARNPKATGADVERLTFRQAWALLQSRGRTRRMLLAVGVGTMAFSMQDILLEPYGGEILQLSVGATTVLTAILAGGSLLGFALAARALTRGADAYRLAATGLLIGIAAFSAVIFSGLLQSAMMFRTGTALIGLGAGLFAVAMLTAAMDFAERGQGGLALGAWGAVQATAAGTGLALGGVLRDVVGGLAVGGRLGPALTESAVGYGFVYHVEIGLLFLTLVVIGPLVRRSSAPLPSPRAKFGLAELPS